MESIDDILNAEDSDDDVLADNVDLEFLLHSRDDFDEDEHDSDKQFLKIDSSGDTRSMPVKVRDRDLVRLEKISAREDVDVTSSSNSWNATPATLEESMSEKNSTDDADFDNTDDNTHDNTKDRYLYLLRQAEQRERKFLEGGQNKVVSALQSKRTSDIVLNYSNVRCDELPLLSDQLKRNSSYKQHGPGAATSMIAHENFIAVGTAKGLIILFGHTQEIRCVLGSSLSIESRPTSSVTSLDAVRNSGPPQQQKSKSLEGLLVSGYATGEVALWDIGKNTILRLVTDLHISAVVTASILDSTSDGLANIGSGGHQGGSGEGGKNLVSLPPVWHHQHHNNNDSSNTTSHPSAAEAPPAASTLASFRFGFSSSIASVAGGSSSASSMLQSSSLVMVSVDSQGVTYKTRFSKTMWSSAYSSESECLLDASTGPLSGYAPLPPLLRSMQANSHYFYNNLVNVPGSKVCCRYVAAHRTARMLAINVGKSQTWIVQTHPKIRILYKWEAPLDPAAAVPREQQITTSPAHGNTPSPAESVGTDPSSSSSSSSRCLDWVWVAQSRQQKQKLCPIIVPDVEQQQQLRHEEEGDDGINDSSEEGVDWVPTLARSWGECVELLSIVTVAAAPTAGAVGTLLPGNSASLGAPVADTAPVPVPVPVGASATAKARPSTSSPYHTKFTVAHRTRFVGQKILSMRWVSSTELVLFTISDVIVTNEVLEIVEKFPLQPSLSMNLSSMFMVEHSSGPITIAASSESSSESSGTPAVAAAAASALYGSVCGRQLFIFANDVLMSVRMQSCFDLADLLAAKGQWLEALALVLENVRRSPNLLQLCGAEVDRYIFRYAELSVKHSGPSSVAAASSMVNAMIVVNAAQNKNHFHLVAGVCIEYCVACSRLDLLFSRVYYIFKSVQRHYIFLESLEPFILSGDISSLPPTLIAEFCESALRLNRLPSIERCVPYFEIAHLDINFITKFLYENRMYSSFLYVYANGLNDFSGAFQIIFNFMLMVGDNSCSVGESGQSVNKAAPPIAGEENADLADVGYKLLLFLCYSFDGKVFPRGGPMLLQQSHGEVSWELLQLVTAPDLRPTPSVFSLQSSAELQASASSFLGAFPYLGKLGEVDMPALFHALHKGIALVQLLANPVHTPAEGEDEDGGEEIPCSTTSFMAMQTPPAVLNKGLSSVFDHILNFCIRVDSRDSLASTVSNNNSNSGGRKEHSSGRTEKIYFEEFADLIVQSRCSLLLSFLERYVQFCAVSSSVSGQEREKCENQLVVLAKYQLKEDPVHCAALASILVENNFGLASLHAVRSVVSAEQFRRSLSFYVKVGTDSPSEMKRFAYQYIDEAMRMATRCEQSSRVVYIGLLRSEMLKMLVPLCYLDLPQTRRLVENYLSAHAAEITENSTQDLKMQFALLSALVPGPEILPGERGRVLRASFTESAVVAYFSLLATYDPSNALTFLKSFESHYPLDACLQICQQKGISEAVAFLMEKKGDVLDALLLLLRDVTTKLKQVRRDVDAQLRSEMATQAAATKAKLQRVGGGDSAVGSVDGERYIILNILGKQDVERAEAAKKLPAFRMLEGLVNCVAELCSRNNLTDQSGGMWLTAFDHLLMERRKYSCLSTYFALSSRSINSSCHRLAAQLLFRGSHLV